MNNKTYLLASAAFTAFATAFESGGWKKDAEGKLVVDDSGNPIYVDGDGRERTVNSTTISTLNGEAKAHREAKEAAEAKLKKFEGIDADKARDAIDKISKIDSKALIDAGKVDEVKAEITRQFEGQLAELKSGNEMLQSKLDNTMISAMFASSEFVRDKIAIPPDMFEQTFKQHFKVEDGKVVPYDGNGNTIYSSSNMGAIADFDDAIVRIVEGYKHKDRILRAPDADGTGNKGGGGNRSATGRTVRRSDFDAMDAVAKQNTAAAAAKGEVSIVD